MILWAAATAIGLPAYQCRVTGSCGIRFPIKESNALLLWAPALAGVSPSRYVSTRMLLFSARHASAADSALCTPTLASLRGSGVGASD